MFSKTGNLKDRSFVRISADKMKANTSGMSLNRDDIMPSVKQASKSELVRMASDSQDQLSHRVYAKFNLSNSKNMDEPTYPDSQQTMKDEITPTMMGHMPALGISTPSLGILRMKPKKTGEVSSKGYLSGVSHRSNLNVETKTDRIFELERELREMQLKYAKMVSIAAQASGRDYGSLMTEELPFTSKSEPREEDIQMAKVTSRLKQVVAEQKDIMIKNASLSKGSSY